MDVELTLRGISAAYGKHTVLEAVDVDTLEGGQLVGLLGPNASGKTTLIAHLGYPTATFKAPMIYNPWFESRGFNAVVMPMACRAAIRATCTWALVGTSTRK